MLWLATSTCNTLTFSLIAKEVIIHTKRIYILYFFLTFFTNSIIGYYAVTFIYVHYIIYINYNLF